MSAWEGSSFQEASEQERDRKAAEMRRAVERSGPHLASELAQRPASYTGLFPATSWATLADVARRSGYSIERHPGDGPWIGVSCDPVKPSVCDMCGKSYEEHGEPRVGAPVPRMPCLGLRKHFVSRNP